MKLIATIFAVAAVAGAARGAHVTAFGGTADKGDDFNAVVNEFLGMLGDFDLTSGNEVKAVFQGANPALPKRVNWDAPENLVSSDVLGPADFNVFNGDAPLARGMEFTIADDVVRPSIRLSRKSFVVEDGVQVPVPDEQQRFGDIDESYADSFQTFSNDRLFTPIGTNTMGVRFHVAGSNAVGTTNGFGAVFTSVDQERTSWVDCFIGDTLAVRSFAPVGLLSFAGCASTRFDITHVQLRSGNVALHNGIADGDVLANDQVADVVVFDDFFCGEPQPAVTAADPLPEPEPEVSEDSGDDDDDDDDSSSSDDDDDDDDDDDSSDRR